MTKATTRVAAGTYETPDGYRIQQAWKQGRSGNPVQSGWNLVDPDGNWCEWYWTKADALDAWQIAVSR